eukprot:gene46536-63044_t
MSTAWAMTKNYVAECTFDMPQPNCTPPKGLKNIHGTILLSSFASGAGYVGDSPDLADRNLFLGGMAADHHIVFYPNSSTLAGMDRWPAAFFGKGLWDRAETLEGTVAAYNRIRGLKAGGDDYMTKPFVFAELLARVEALTRRGKTEGPATKLVVADLEMDD